MRMIIKTKILPMWQFLQRHLLPSPKAWRSGGMGVLALGLTVLLIYFLLVILAHFSMQKLPAFLVWATVPAALGLGILLAAAALQALPLTMRLPLVLVAPLLFLSIFPGGMATDLVGSLLLLGVAAVWGASVDAFVRRRLKFSQRRVLSGALLLSVLALVAGLAAVFVPKEDPNPVLADYVLEDRTLDLANPGLPGDHPVLELSYGSGQDRHRPEYGSGQTLQARSVDGSKLIDNWDGLTGWLRSSYWGFDVTELPLQARVWYPAGDGPFPLVLIVHGNHGMEDYSDPGYAYLGEFFASRGTIFASVDENFINSSVADRVDFLADRPGLREENDARGWLLLEHLRQWRDWNAEAGHLFQGKVDMDKIALIGHSRGGEAVGIAAAFNGLDRYPDDATLEFDYGFNLRGVIAIAPVYGQYQPRERPTPVRDVNYFTIHGDMDGDVQSFEGLAQYSRVGFSEQSFRFRSSLYVQGANHGQFNTGWGNLDVGRFRGWALDLSRIMEGEAQRDVARVYFSAFLEVVFNERREYLPIFQDARHAAGWLPARYYINQYHDSNEDVIVDFETDLDPSTLDGGGKVTAEHLTRWYEVANELKFDDLDTHSLVASWDGEVNDDIASIGFALAAPVGGQTLIASLSAVDIPTKPRGWEADGEAEANRETNTEELTAEAGESAILDWTVVLTDANGRTASLPLSYDAGLFPLIKAVPRRAGFLDSTAATEILFRRFEFPLASFQSEGGFDSRAISEIGFRFDRSDSGAMMLDYLAIAP